MIGKVITLIVPLVSYVAFHAVTKPPFMSFSCSALNYGCLTDIPAHGSFNEEFQDAYNVFLGHFQQGKDIGGALTVYVDGKQVMDVQAGWQDLEKRIPYSNETLQMVWSSTKTLSSVIIAQLVEQGLLNYDERISTYWPEFAQGNKENVTLGDLMRHKAGVAWLDYPLSYENVSDPTALSNILAAQPHNFGGEAVHAYHVITLGFYQNEIIRRVDPQRRTINDFALEFKQKWDSEWYLKPDLTEGVDLNRIAPFYEMPMYQMVADLISALVDPAQNRTFLLSMFQRDSIFHRAVFHVSMDQLPGIITHHPKHRQVEAPAYSGHTNTNSMAKIAAMLANRGKAIVQGEPNLFENDATYANLVKDVGLESDYIFPYAHIHHLYGGLLLFPNYEYTKSSKVEDADFIGGVGVGGSFFVFSEKYNIGFAYMTNAYINNGRWPDQRCLDILRAVVETVTEKKQLK